METYQAKIRPSMLKYWMLFFPLILISSCLRAGQDQKNRNENNSAIMSRFQDDSLQWKNKARDMVSEQLISRGIADQKVLSVMAHTPRHLFIPEILAELAYLDRPLPIGEGQTISQPYIVALMTELLQLKGHEKVLEIGTGSGYQAAVLSPLVDTCFTIELVKKLAAEADSVLKQLGYHNVVTRCGDGYRGWPEHAPFDRIIITAAPEEIPEALVKQLKPDGIMVLPVGKKSQDLIVVTKTKTGIKKERIIPVRFVPMVKPN